MKDKQGTFTGMGLACKVRDAAPAFLNPKEKTMKEKIVNWLEDLGDAMDIIIEATAPWVCWAAIGVIIFQVFIRPFFHAHMGW